MRIIVSETQFKNIVEDLAAKTPDAEYEATKNQYIKLAQSKKTYGFGEGRSQDQNIAKEKAYGKALDMLADKTGQYSPSSRIIEDSLFKLDDGYHQLLVIELRA